MALSSARLGVLESCLWSPNRWDPDGPRRVGHIDRRIGDPRCARRCRRTDARTINPLTASFARSRQQTGPFLTIGKKRGGCRSMLPMIRTDFKDSVH